MAINEVVNVEELQAQLEHQVKTAIAGFEHSERRDYETAMEISPELVQAETRLMDFLRTEHWNPLLAGARLARYWKFRKVLFADRWLLPMNQTGTGALSTSDIEFLRTGATVVTQRGPYEGILSMADETRLPRWPGITHSRLIYYFMTILTDEPSQTKGITILHLIRSGERPMVDIDRNTFDMYNSGLPVRVKQVIVAQAYEFGKETILKFLADRQALAIEFKRRHHPKRIEATSTVETLRQLQEKGCAKNLMPHSFGGDYDYARFNDWICMRISLEDIMASTPLRYNQLSLPNNPNSASMSANQASGWRVAGTLVRRQSESTGKPESEKEFVKKRNAVYSRRLYHRRKLELLAAEEQAKVLKQRKQELEVENSRLVTLLKSARHIVDGVNQKKHSGKC